MLRHILIPAAALLLILGIPIFRSDAFARAVGRGDVDAVSSPSLIIEQPSGAADVFINRDKHPDEETLQSWTDFFSGQEIPVLFEDLSCLVVRGDAVGLEMAQSFQSRLPENQMTIREEDGTLILSRAEVGKYDVLILSREIAGMYTAESLDVSERNLHIEIGGDA